MSDDRPRSTSAATTIVLAIVIVVLVGLCVCSGIVGLFMFRVSRVSIPPEPGQPMPPPAQKSMLKHFVDEALGQPPPGTPAPPPVLPKTMQSTGPSAKEVPPLDQHSDESRGGSLPDQGQPADTNN